MHSLRMALIACLMISGSACTTVQPAPKPERPDAKLLVIPPEAALMPAQPTRAEALAVTTGNNELYTYCRDLMKGWIDWYTAAGLE